LGQQLSFSAYLAAVLVPGAGGQPNSTVTIQVDDPRPLAKAAEMLETNLGVPINYEDPEYASDEDLVDVTDATWRAANPGDPKRALVPRGGALEVSYQPNHTDGSVDDPGPIIQEIIDAHRAHSYPGVFILRHEASVYTITPTQVKDANGRLTPQQSAFDTAISFPQAERSGYETLELIIGEISAIIGKHIGIGTVPINYLSQQKVTIGAQNEPARQVLIRSFAGLRWINSYTALAPQQISWQLFYAPDARMYFVNLHGVVAKGAEPPRFSIAK
jgi:hypothetical protein